MAPTRDDYEALHAGFRWQVPARTNIAELCCARWARSPGRTAIVFDRGDGRVEATSYQDLHRAANRLANALAALGVKRGDRVAIVLPQRPETAVAHFAIYRLGAIAMPLEPVGSHQLAGSSAFASAMSRAGSLLPVPLPP